MLIFPQKWPPHIKCYRYKINLTMKRKKSNMPIMEVGWYKKEQWTLLRENSEDVDDLENTFYEWVANANDTVKKFSSSGYRIEKIEIDVKELIEWCKREKCALNGGSRSNFISLKTKEKFRQPGV